MTSEATDGRIHLSWSAVNDLADELCDRWRLATLAGVYGVPRGGVPVALLVSQRLRIPVADRPGRGVLVVDDLVDSGATRDRFADSVFDALLCKPHSPPQAVRSGTRILDGWVVFPWERDTDETAGPTDAVVRLLNWIGEDASRDGLADTPSRVVRALSEMTAGYRMDPAEILARTFDEAAYDEMVLVRGIDFTSMCEHHLLTFTGTATVAYIPDAQRVVGLSKLARLVDCFSMRLQLQERLTIQIADAIETHLQPRGVGVLVRARHSCMGCRGVRKPGAEMVTSRLTGFFKDDPKARAELLSLA